MMHNGGNCSKRQAGITSGTAQISRSAKKTASVRAKALGCSGALSQRNNVWLSDSMRSLGRIASEENDPSMLSGNQSRLSWSSSCSALSSADEMTVPLSAFTRTSKNLSPLTTSTS